MPGPYSYFARDFAPTLSDDLDQGSAVKLPGMVEMFSVLFNTAGTSHVCLLNI